MVFLLINSLQTLNKHENRPCSCLNKRNSILIMITRIYNLFSFVFLSILLIGSIQLNNPESANAMPSKADVAFSAMTMDVEKGAMSSAPIEQDSDLTSQPTKEPTQSLDQNKFPDLGDDQVFPFVAGLDSYEGRS